MNTDSITPAKVCTVCGIEFPATSEYFYGHPTGYDGLMSVCKVCKRQYQQAKRHRKHPPKPVAPLGYKFCSKCGEILPATSEYFGKHKSRHDGLRSECRACNNARMRDWYSQNKEKSSEYQREYYSVNRDYILKRVTQYAKVNTERIKNYKRLHLQNNPALYKVSRHRRKARKRNLPNTFTAEQWKASLEYFYGCCAVCGSQLFDLFGNVIPHADHWIPLNSPDCPGTTIDNMLPLCNHCNLSKGAKHPKQWLAEKYGRNQARQILERIETYFQWAWEFFGRDKPE